jgi:hypothetical protein
MPIGDYVKEAEKYGGGRSAMQYAGCIEATALSRAQSLESARILDFSRAPRRHLLCN